MALQDTLALLLRRGLTLIRTDRSLQTRLTVALCLLILAGIAGLLTSFLSIHHIQHQFARSLSAHHQLARYLELSNETHAFFLNLATGAAQETQADAWLTEAEPPLAALWQLKRQTVADYDALAETLGPLDLTRLEAAETRLTALVSDYATARDLAQDGRMKEARAQSVRLLMNAPHETLSDFLSVALDWTHRKVHYFEEDARASAHFVEAAILLQIVLTIPLTILISISLLRRLNHDTLTLMDGTRAIAQGDFGHRIPVLRDVEFRLLGESFNTMAGDLAAQRDALEHANRDLENQVAERTADLQKAHDRLTATDQTRRQFLADISHELRTPLTIIRGEAEVSLRGADKPVAVYRDSLRRIIGKCTGVARLVEDLLFLARSEAGDIPLERACVGLARIAADCVQDFLPLADERAIALRHDVSGLSDLKIDGDADRLTQALSVLLDNALRYCQSGDAIAVIGCKIPGHLEVRVEDTGPGIPAEDVASVFTRFYRGRTTQAAVAGTGLGLPVAKAIIEAHGGRLHLTNREDGRGLRATMTLPLPEDAPL